MKSFVYILLTIFFLSSQLQSSGLNKDKEYSIHIGSYLKHLRENSPQVEDFDNKLFDIEYKIDKNYADNIILGTIINSSGNRCMMIGIQKNYYDFSDRLSFEGTYIYSGEFFFDAFKQCGDGGVYKTLKEKSGIAFAPYIYHGLEYDISSNISLEGGVILPGLVLLNIQFHF